MSLDDPLSIKESTGSPTSESQHVVKELENQSINVDYKRLLRKLDWRILPYVSLLYLLSFLDRTNIGNARVAGMATDLKLTGLRYNIAVAVFFVPYCIFEIPSNVAMKVFRPSIWLPSIMVAWGITMLAMGFVKSYHGLLIARAFLGLAEAGLFPGVNYYICLWYPRDAQAARVAIFLSAATIAGAFGGLLAFGIEDMKGLGGLAGWSWIFVLEGILTVLVALLSYITIYDFPETAKFLKTYERDWLVNRLKEDNAGLAKHFRMQFLWQALKDPKLYVLSVIYFGVVVPSYGSSFFVPTIINGLGFSAARAQLLSVPPYVLAASLTITLGILSDKYRMRGPFILGGTALSIVGYAILYATKSAGAGYAGTILSAAGEFPAVALVVAFTGGNAGGDIKRGVALAMTIGLGNLGGIAASFIYRTQDSPRYHLGHGFIIGCLSLSFVLTACMMVHYNRLNKAKEARCEAEGIDHSRWEEFKDMGDDSPLFRYML